MNKFRIGDTLVIVAATAKNNVGKVGMVTEVTDGDYYTLDCLPNYAFKENCLSRAMGADLIREERRRQIEVEGYDAEHDSGVPLYNFAFAAISYAMCDIDMEAAKKWWPWDIKLFKPKDRKRNLIRAAALHAAAIDKIQEKEASERNKQQVEKTQGEQKPVEWSDEEKKKLDRIYYILGIAADEHAYSNTCRLIGDKEAVELQDFLRSIAKPQPKQEWSKEDVEMIDRLIRHCKKEYEELCNDRYGHQEIVSDLKSSCRERWDWLESLKDKVSPQYHWKPSEGQIKALRWVLGNIPYNIHKEEISGLLDQLKTI